TGSRIPSSTRSTPICSRAGSTPTPSSRSSGGSASIPSSSTRRSRSRVVPTFNYFQTAVVLAADGVLDAEDVATVARSLVETAGYAPRGLENSLHDLVRRGAVAP